MFYSCACIPCFQQISCRSRDGTMTAATGRFCVTRTFSKRAHLLVRPVNEDELWTSEAGMVHLFLFCFAVLPSEAKGKWFSNELNSAPWLCRVIYWGPRGLKKEFGISKGKPEAWGRKQTKVWKWWRVTNETIMVMKAQTRFLSAIPRPSQEPVFSQFHRPNNSFKKDLSFRTRFIVQFMALICIKGDANRGAWSIPYKRIQTKQCHPETVFHCWCRKLQ